jgi:hypothetical protein
MSRKSSGASDMWIIVPLAIAVLLAFSWHAASINGYNFWSRETLFEVLPWLAAIVVILAAWYVADFIRTRQKNRHPEKPD